METEKNIPNDIDRRDGHNAKLLMKIHEMDQKSLAARLGWHESVLSNMLKENVIEDGNLEKIAKAIDERFTADCIKYYNHNAAKEALVQNIFQTVNDGGKAFNAGSNNNENNIINELDFIKEYGITKEKLMYYRMLVEPDKVKAERENKE